ncbi:branched-chain amino acid ABC transporter substrate-binding protein [Derxia gummosa]|uniref:Branched-chain amino acid ABC transporter substrate-binding protein n=1 Tax=Derxia gummosa DSM 723 TaxID=1121388 RepID=A0A8B6X5X3_9BURK|nr:branched-chain amino acid ABC transporter substrate-binding protein [Derxia gummosa]
MHKFAGMLLPAFCVLAVASNAEAQEAVIKIGHVAPMSGGQAHLGKDNEAGAKLAIEDLNKAGITIGGKKAKFVLVSEDDGADPRQGTAVAQKLVDAKVVGVVGHLNSGTSIPASKIYYDAGIPQISPSSTAPKYTQQGFNTTFRVVANDSQLGARLGQYAVSQLKAKKVAVIDDRTAYGQGVADEFSKAAKAAGAAIVATQFTTDKATEFSAILTAVKSAAPDVVFYGGMDAQAGPLLRQMKQLGINAKLMGGDGICTEGLVNLAGDGMADGQVICAEAGGVTGEEEKGMEAFRADFKKRTGGEVQLYAPYVYDAVMVLADSIKKAGSAEPDRYLPYLAKADYKGVTGRISFDSKGDIKNGSLTLYSYKAGKRERIAVVK